MNATTNPTRNTPMDTTANTASSSRTGRLFWMLLLIVFGAFVGLCVSVGDGSALSESIAATLEGDFSAAGQVLGGALSEARGIIGAVLGGLCAAAMFMLVQTPDR